jgi:hypothetical protein
MELPRAASFAYLRDDNLWGHYSGMSCLERDRIMLAFALAANERNIAVGDWESAAGENEREAARQIMQTAESSCHELRAMVLNHCQEHGC